MNRIFREVIGLEHPIFSHKILPYAECQEQLICQRDVIGYVHKGRKQVNFGDYIEAGQVYYMSIDSFNVTNYADKETGTYEEYIVCFDVKDLREFIINPFMRENFIGSIIETENAFVDTWVTTKTSDRVRAAIGMIFNIAGNTNDTNSTSDTILTRTLDKVRLLGLLLTILTDEKSPIASAIVRLIKCNYEHLRLVMANRNGKYETISDIAAKCDMSLSQFKKIFAQLYGTSPHRWMLNQQLERSAFLLANSDYPISQIAEECGFSNPSHLDKRFRTMYQMTPSQYRNRVSVY